jgi:hypothetical protein
LNASVCFSGSAEDTTRVGPQQSIRLAAERIPMTTLISRVNPGEELTVIPMRSDEPHGGADLTPTLATSSAACAAEVVGYSQLEISAQCAVAIGHKPV